MVNVLGELEPCDQVVEVGASWASFDQTKEVSSFQVASGSKLIFSSCAALFEQLPEPIGEGREPDSFWKICIVEVVECYRDCTFILKKGQRTIVWGSVFVVFFIEKVVFWGLEAKTEKMVFLTKVGI